MRRGKASEKFLWCQRGHGCPYKVPPIAGDDEICATRQSGGGLQGILKISQRQLQCLHDVCMSSGRNLGPGQQVGDDTARSSGILLALDEVRQRRN